MRIFILNLKFFLYNNSSILKKSIYAMENYSKSIRFNEIVKECFIYILEFKYYLTNIFFQSNKNKNFLLFEELK